MRSIALDVHRDFCEVAIKDESGLRLAGRVKSSPAELELFAQSLAPDDQVALEATGPALAIARVRQPHVGRVLARTARTPGARRTREIACFGLSTVLMVVATPWPGMANGRPLFRI